MSKVYLTQSGQFTAKHGHTGVLNEETHEHTFRYEITFFGALNHEHYLLDFRQLSESFKEEFGKRLNGSDLSAFLPYPTTEALAIWMFNRIKKQLPALYSVKVAEEADRWVEYRGDE